jgi:hypothetical protein
MHNNKILFIGDYNNQFEDSNIQDVYGAFLFTEKKYGLIPFVEETDDPLISILPERKLHAIYMNTRTITPETVPLSDHNIVSIRLSDLGIENDGSIVLWNANSKIHNPKTWNMYTLSNYIIHRKIYSIINAKLDVISTMLQNQENHIIVLNEWGNVNFDMYKNKYETPQKAFSNIYGYKAFRGKGISMCSFRQYIGTQTNTSDIKEGVENCEWVMFVGEAGKSILFRQSSINKHLKLRPIQMNKNDTLSSVLYSNLKLENNKGFHTNIFTNMLPIPLTKGGVLYISAIHDTARGAYTGKYSDPHRWKFRNEEIYKWINKYNILSTNMLHNLIV